MSKKQRKRARKLEVRAAVEASKETRIVRALRSQCAWAKRPGNSHQIAQEESLLHEFREAMRGYYG